MSESFEWSEKGNEFYRNSKAEGLAPTLQLFRCKKALECYSYAVSMTTKQRDRSSIFKNQGTVIWKMSSAQMQSDNAHPSIKMYFREALKYFQEANENGQDRDAEWRDTLTNTALTCLREAKDWMKGWDSEAFNVEMETMLPFVFHEDTKANEYLDVGISRVNSGSAYLKNGDCKKSLASFADAHFPLTEAQRWARNNEGLSARVEEADELRITKQRDAESTQARLQGEAILAKILEDKSNMDLNLGLDAVDLFREAAVLTKDQNLVLEAMALSYLGKVFNEVFRNRETAKRILMTVVQFAHSFHDGSFVQEEWYKYARNTIERFQKETVEEGHIRRMKERLEIMKIIQKDVDFLALQHEKDEREFLRLIYDKYPPKDPEHTLGSIPENCTNADIRKLYRHAAIHYHPDKVDQSVHGAQWKVMSEEIAKLVTATYGNFKGKEDTKPFEPKDKPETQEQAPTE